VQVNPAAWRVIYGFRTQLFPRPREPHEMTCLEGIEARVFNSVSMNIREWNLGSIRSRHFWPTATPACPMKRHNIRREKEIKNELKKKVHNSTTTLQIFNSLKLQIEDIPNRKRARRISWLISNLCRPQPVLACILPE
jgi:hypothetical protein